MTPERYRAVVALFERTCALPPEARAAFLSDAAGDDAELAQAVRGMLAQDGRQSLLPTGGAGPAALLGVDMLRQSGPETTPERIGEYRILGVLGAGAMGTVYRAEQQNPRREVALKTIHWWMLTPAAVDRFRFEAQALAQLQHPGIPQVHAVCESEHGISFAMELVAGEPLARHAERLRHDTPALLRLVAELADAVHHAHLRGLVHRDLKPDNVRVTGAGRPKVLDFGISLPVDLGGKGAAPAGEVAGTLAYMSPEQLWPDRGIDIRADVYALGVIAYELFAGVRPFELSGLSFEEARQKICEAPVRPLSAHRAALRGEVSAIVERAMSRTREERYASAADLAEDLRRHLDHRPVTAYPGGAAYRLRKLVRRHRLASAGAAVAFLGLSLAGGASFALFRQADRALVREGRLRAEAESSRDAARREAQKSSATVEFLSQLLREADPNAALGEPVTVREALDKAAARLDAGSLQTQPEVEASVRLTLAQTYRALGLHDPTAAQVVAAARLGEEGLLSAEAGAETLLALADVKGQRGEFEEAGRAITRALQLERAQHPAPHLHVSRTFYIAGQIERERGDLQAGEAHFREAVAIARRLQRTGGIPEEEVSSTLNQLGNLLVIRGEYDEAERLFREALEIDTRLFGPEHPEVAIDLHNLAWLMHEAERPGDARGLLDRALAIRVRTLGPRHPRIGMQQMLLASIELEAGALEAAERASAAGNEILAAAFRPDHPVVIRNQPVGAQLSLARGRLGPAQSTAEATLEAHRRVLGDAHWATAEVKVLLADVLIALGVPDRAQPLLSEAQTTYERTVGMQGRSARQLARVRQRLATVSVARP